jgi:lipopolysaccharide export system protein LptC
MTALSAACASSSRAAAPAINWSFNMPDTARMSSDGEEVLLTGNVRLTRAPTANQSELVLLTTSLLVTPNKGFARTADPVVIQNATSHTDAVGLEFDYNTRQLTLLRDVRTTFRPGP